MAVRLVMLNNKDYRKVTKKLRNKGSALISTRRAVVDETDDNLNGILVGDTLVLCATSSTKPQIRVRATESNREPHDPDPALIKCVPA